MAKFDLDSMTNGSARIKTLTERFAEEIRHEAAALQWTGDSRDAFDASLESTLDKVSDLMIATANIPADMAKRFSLEDKNLAVEISSQ